MTADPEITRRMKALRKALEKRMALDERAEELARRERAARPIRCGELASFDSRGLGRRLRPMLEHDGRGWKAIAGRIGVTSSDLSRIVAGQDISAAKVFAICDWAGLDARAFYRPATGAAKPRATPRPAGAKPRKTAVFHGKSTETENSGGRHEQRT